jgi:hypothetical protein
VDDLGGVAFAAGDPVAGDDGGVCPGGAGFCGLFADFDAGSLASLTVPSESGLTPGVVTVPAGADERDEEDVPEGSSRLSFGTRRSPRCNRQFLDPGQPR